MLSSKSKSGLSEASVNKGSPATPRASKFGRAGSLKADPDTPSPQQPSRLSIDRSPRSVDSKPAAERRSSLISTPPDKQSRVLKGSDLQTQLATVQEDLKKAKERLAAVEKEKARILDELKDAKKSAEETNEKLEEALVAQKRAEEASEIDKFRADELEQASIEVSQKREDEWQKELESVRNQHALDIAALVATTQELQRSKHELAMITEAKNTALSHADDAMKIAEINAEKVGILSAEINRLKALLDSTMEGKPSEASDLVKKGLDFQAKLGVVEEDLRKANEQLASAEREKTQILEELKDARRMTDEANEKIKEGLTAQKKAQDALEMERIRANDLEQESMKAARKREDEWQKKVDNIHSQHAIDIAALHSAVKELERMKHELAMTTEAKNAALSHADDAMKIAEVNAENAIFLSAEISQLKTQLDSKSQLSVEISTLKDELQKAKVAEVKLAEMEVVINGLKIEITDRKKAESDSEQLVNEWKRKAEILEVQLHEADESRKSTMESLASVTKQLEERNLILQEKDRDATAFKDKVDFLELEVTGLKAELDETNRHLEMAQEETLSMGNLVEVLKSELQNVEVTISQSMHNEKVATSKIDCLTEERNKLINELETTRDDAEKVKKAMEGLASALHDASSEARCAQERVLAKESEVETANAQIEELKLTIKRIQESYEVSCNEAKGEILHLQKSVEKFETEIEKSRSEWDLKELDFQGSIRKSEEEILGIKAGTDKMVESLKEAELELQAAKEDQLRLLDRLKHLESETIIAKKVAEEAKAESLQLKEALLDKENAVQSLCQENDDLRIQETAALKKVEELSSLLDEATTKKQEEDVELPISAEQSSLHEQFDTLENGDHGDGQEMTRSDCPVERVEENGRDEMIPKEESNNAQDPSEAEGKVHENGNNMEKDFAVERELEVDSVEDETEAKTDGVNLETNGLASDIAENGANSPKQQQQQKKKKAFIQKFGSLLKKKSNHK